MVDIAKLNWWTIHKITERTQLCCDVSSVISSKRRQTTHSHKAVRTAECGLARLVPKNPESLNPFDLTRSDSIGACLPSPVESISANSLRSEHCWLRLSLYSNWIDSFVGLRCHPSFHSIAETSLTQLATGLGLKRGTSRPKLSVRNLNQRVTIALQTTNGFRVLPPRTNHKNRNFPK